MYDKTEIIQGHDRLQKYNDYHIVYIHDQITDWLNFLIF